MSEGKHPLIDYPEDGKIAYLSIVASMAAADNEVADEEISALRELCKSVEISSKGLGLIMATAEDPSGAPIEEYLKQLSASELRFSLMTDIIAMAFADEKVTFEEEEEIGEIAKLLKIKPEQIGAIRKYVEAIHIAQTSGNTEETLKKLGGDVAAGLASTGVPIAAVTVAGTYGVSAAGITSGLAALGLGFGMMTGIGTAVALGVGTYAGTRWLYKKIVGA